MMNREMMSLKYQLLKLYLHHAHDLIAGAGRKPNLLFIYCPLQLIKGQAPKIVNSGKLNYYFKFWWEKINQISIYYYGESTTKLNYYSTNSVNCIC